MPSQSQKRFNNNIVKLSTNKNYDECIDEWHFIGHLKKDEFDNNCLCGRLLKNQYFYINENTCKIICSGDNCRQKLEKIEKKTKTNKK